MNLEHNLNIAIQAAYEAGLSIMDIYQTDFSVDHKEDESPLTIADKKANDIITEFLKETAFPIISEESRQAPYETRKLWDTCWVVDPLDGTKEFIKRNGEFTVNIALVKNGKPILGVIYVPVTKEMFFTDPTFKGSYKVQMKTTVFEFNELKEIGEAITPAKKDESPLRIVGSRSHLNKDTEDYVDNLKKTVAVEIVSKGSSLKFCLVAEGKAHKYPRFAPTMEWDTAAGQAICEAVGLQVLDATTNRPLLYNKENLLNPYFLVTY